MRKNIDYSKLELTQPLEQCRLNLHPGDPISQLLELAEKHVIGLAIERCKGNQFACAKALGISRGTLRTKLKRHFGDKYMIQSV